MSHVGVAKGSLSGVKVATLFVAGTRAAARSVTGVRMGTGPVVLWQDPETFSSP